MRMLHFHLVMIALLGAASPSFAAFNPKKIITGSYHTCALSTAGELRCWGNNNDYQLGTRDDYRYGFYPDSMGSHLPKVDLGQGVKAADVCAGGRYTCAITSEGRVKCFGDNSMGQLGSGRIENSSVNMGDKLPYAALGKDFYAQKITCGESHVCAMNSLGQVKCWGKNSDGQLGLGDMRHRGGNMAEMGDHLPFLFEGAKVQSIGTGADHTCALLSDGVRCFGKGSFGALGNESYVGVGTSAPVTLANLPPLKFVAENIAIKLLRLSVGGHFNCVSYLVNGASNTEHKCWGYNAYGALGVEDNINYGGIPSSMGDHLPRTKISDDIIDWQGHAAFGCVLIKSGKIKCWGTNGVGQLGQGDMENRGDSKGEMGENLRFVDLGLPAKAISSGAFNAHTCAILINSSIKCWGYNVFGQLGYENNINVGVDPIQMGDNLQVVHLE